MYCLYYTDFPFYDRGMVSTKLGSCKIVIEKKNKFLIYISFISENGEKKGYIETNGRL